MLVVFFQVVFSNQKTVFLAILYFMYLPDNMRVCLFQSVVSNFCHGDCKLILHVLRGREICHLVLFELLSFKLGLMCGIWRNLKSDQFSGCVFV